MTVSTACFSSPRARASRVVGRDGVRAPHEARLRPGTYLHRLATLYPCGSVDQRPRTAISRAGLGSQTAGTGIGDASTSRGKTSLDGGGLPAGAPRLDAAGVRGRHGRVGRDRDGRRCVRRGRGHLPRALEHRPADERLLLPGHRRGAAVRVGLGDPPRRPRRARHGHTSRRRPVGHRARRGRPLGPRRGDVHVYLPDRSGRCRLGGADDRSRRRIAGGLQLGAGPVGPGARPPDPDRALRRRLRREGR